MKLLSVVKRPLHWAGKELPIGTHFRADGRHARMLIATGRAEEVRHPPSLSPVPPPPRRSYRRRDMFAERPSEAVAAIADEQPTDKADTE